MSKIFILIIENNSILFGQLHWRNLFQDFKTQLNRVDFDGGFIFVDKNKDLIIEDQSCVDLNHLCL